MKLKELKKTLSTVTKINFQLENGLIVPKHFHITEVGVITKDFIDCGGVIRNEKVINFQLWYSDDTNHILKPNKLMDIIDLSEKEFSMENLDVEVEYQSDTIGKYDISFKENNFVLINKKTNCLAEDKCGIIPEKIKKPLGSLENNLNSCNPEDGCC
tara:strand:- start:135 stop:605 length:471 start_codon:yes stop_codon:yes gene_type:complete